MTDAATVTAERSDLAELEEIERQTTIAVNHHTRHRTKGRGIFPFAAVSPNIARASVSRDSKKPPQAVTRISTAPDVEDREMFDRAMRDARARWMMPIRSMEEIVAAARARREELGLTLECIDEIAGWAPRYASKILSPQPVKNLGWMSLGSLLGTIGTALIMVEDPEQIQRVKDRWTPRERPNQARPRRRDDE